MSSKYLNDSGLAYFWTKIKAYVAGLLGTKADDADVVHKTGNEDVSGNKHFKNHCMMEDGFRMHDDKSNEFSKGNNPSSTSYGTIFIVGDGQYGVGDQLANRLLEYNCSIDTSGVTRQVLRAFNNTANATDWADLGLVNDHGTAYAYCPTPVSNANDTKIATTEWVRSATGNTTLNAATATEADHLSSHPLGDDYEMTATDFLYAGYYSVATFRANTSSAPSGNAGDYRLYAFSGNYNFNDFLCTSPRQNSLFFGHFWNGVFQGWHELCNLDTSQTITGKKTFNGGVDIYSGLQNQTASLNIRSNYNADEGGQINFFAPDAGTQYNGFFIDNYKGQLRLLGLPSADGTTKTGNGTALTIDMYAKTITGGYTFTGELSGNAATATKLATARTINGVSFDGSANITVEDSTKVAKSGDTMTGVLNGTGVYISGTFAKKHLDVVKGTNPSSVKYWTLNFCDKNGIDFADNVIGQFETNISNSGVVATYIRAMKNEAANTSRCEISCVYDTANDTAYTAAPTPATSDNSTKIATTAFVKAQGYITSSDNAFGLASKGLGSDYEMTHTDFDNRGIGIWKADFKANTTSAPRYNDGDFAIMKLYNTGNSTYAPFLCISPRRDLLYFGKFWNGTWQKWNEVFSSSQHIRLDEGNTIHRAKDTSALWVCGGTSIDSSSFIFVAGQDYSNAGMFSCVAKKGSTSSSLIGVYDGNLTWNGQTIQTSSDARLKTSLASVPDGVLDAWGGVDWGQFKFLAAIEEKGDSARRHVGLIAQQVLAAFDAQGMDACDYGIACHDVWDDEYYEDTVTGEKTLINKAGETWMIRYTEALCMEAAYQRRENARLKERVAFLEERLAALELKLS